MRMRRKRREIEQKLILRKQYDKDLVEKQRNTVDFEVDNVVKGHLNTTVMVGGIAYVVALCFCIVGLLTPENTSLTTFGSASRTGDTDYEFVGYGSWQNFTRGCCCTSMSQGDYVVEKWVCDKSVVKERLRSNVFALPQTVGAYDNISTVVYNGYGIRDLCSPVFKSGCRLIASTDNARVGMYCVDNMPEVSGVAMGKLW